MEKLVIVKSLRYLLIILLAVFAYSCKTKKVVTLRPTIDSAAVQTGADKELVEDKPADSLLKVIRQKELTFKTLTAKIDVDAAIKGETNSFKCNIRIIQDSAIWINITPVLGIEVARVLITKDSVKFINRITNKYFLGDFKFVNDLLQLDADYDMVQSMLLAKTYLYYDSKNYLTSVDDDKYLISSLPKRKIKRTITDEENTLLLVHANWVNPINFMVNKLFIKDFENNRKLEVNYTNFETVDGQPIPHLVDIDVKADKPAHIKLVYSKVVLNKDVNLPFSIPDGFERITQ